MPNTPDTQTPNPQTLKLFYEPKDRLRLTISGDRSYHTVKPAWAAPLSRPGQYLALLDGKGNAIVTLPDPSVLPPDSLAAAKEELRRRYLTATVRAIAHAKQEFGATYWSVQTDRGDRDFVTQNLQENAIWLSPTHLLLLDVDGNRFEIIDTEALDPASRNYVATLL
jgi:hypothetical protein